MSLSSVPPPPRPGLARAMPVEIALATRGRPLPRKPSISAEMFAARMRVAEIVHAYIDAKRISNQELAECWRCTEHAVRDMRAGERPISIAHILALPKTHARALLYRVLDALDVAA